jgi:CBS domain-containing protein/Kef-type K+ transport system membrane component KefB
MPRVVGYLAAGLALKWFVPEPEYHPFEGLQSGVRDFALGIILFAIGSAFDRTHFRRIGRSALRVSAAEATVTLVLVAIGCGIVSSSASVGWFMGTMAIATAPAATLLVLREYEAKGPIADHLLVLTGLNNVISIVLFHIGFLIIGEAGWSSAPLIPVRNLILDVVILTVGSLILGAVLGLLLSIIHAAANPSETAVLFFATMLGLAAAVPIVLERWSLPFNFLLVCLGMGATFANVAVGPDRLNNLVNGMAGPVFAGFFVLAGYGLHLDDLPKLGLLGGAYCVLRTAGKVLGVGAGLRWARTTDHAPSTIGLGLTCQAGVAIGLAAYLVEHMATATGAETESMATRIQTVILASVAIFELVGPILVKTVLMRGGEIKAISLIPRTSATIIETGEVAAGALRSFLRLISRGGRTESGGENLTVQHIMRSNVKSLGPAATLPDVMHFVERSHLSEFPVTDADGKLIGMIAFSDIRDIMYDPALKELVTAVDLTRSEVSPVLPDQTLTELLERFASTDFSALPVVDSRKGRRLIGVVEQRDLLHAMH